LTAVLIGIEPPSKLFMRYPGDYDYPFLLFQFYPPRQSESSRHLHGKTITNWALIVGIIRQELLDQRKESR
ncbi:MAG TPA: hypothetical protein VEO92_04935, partial [Candidatus Nitrosocosmicus sp.]|nr:hypothetical protein [Candidatus Nitrosocosmicus sp.]